ncbi:MAG TPA: LLM class flavin-dependent oxidoreductase [Spirochaetia bacterium]|nr:LLM class flavin-dependent oxidoreductase [Spirochaetia bacterium]
MEIGIYSFADLTPDVHTRRTISPTERMRDIVEEIELADQVGLDVYGMGEHHRPDFISSAPAVVLAAGAARTKRIRLTSAVSVLSSDDPVRVYQDFATLDLVSGGRAEIMAGRGSFIESFPLFGYDLDDYDELFQEKLDLLLAVRAQEKVTWSGKFRPPLQGLGVYPRSQQQPLPVWVAVGGSADSVARTAQLGLPLALAIIGGQPARFKPFIDLYRQVAREAGHPASTARVSINSHGYVADTSQQAAEEHFPAMQALMAKIGRERGWPPMSRAQFDADRGPSGHLLLGSPQEVIDKMLFEHEVFHFDRFLIQFSVGTIPHDRMMHSIELFGTRVAPEVRKATAPAAPASRESAPPTSEATA